MEQEYYSVNLEVESDIELDRVVTLARSMNYYRIYIDEPDGVVWTDDSDYQVEVLFTNEHDVTMFQLKL
jgi:hypothetical protein